MTRNLGKNMCAVQRKELERGKGRGIGSNLNLELQSNSTDQTDLTCFGFFSDTAPDKGLCIPLVGAKHVRAIMDAQDGHLISIL